MTAAPHFHPKSSEGEDVHDLVRRSHRTAARARPGWLENNSGRIPQSMALNDFSKGSVAGTSDIDEPYHENNQLLRLLVISAN
jgi:hypothetical protein